MYKIEIFNTHSNDIEMVQKLSPTEIRFYDKYKTRFAFILKGYNSTNNVQFLYYSSLKLENIIDRLLREQDQDYRNNTVNKYIITLEEV